MIGSKGSADTNTLFGHHLILRGPRWLPAVADLIAGTDWFALQSDARYSLMRGRMQRLWHSSMFSGRREAGEAERCGRSWAPTRGAPPSSGYTHMWASPEPLLPQAYPVAKPRPCLGLAPARASCGRRCGKLRLHWQAALAARLRSACEVDASGERHHISWNTDPVCYHLPTAATLTSLDMCLDLVSSRLVISSLSRDVFPEDSISTSDWLDTTQNRYA